MKFMDEMTPLEKKYSEFVYLRQVENSLVTIWQMAKLIHIEM